MLHQMQVNTGYIALTKKKKQELTTTDILNKARFPLPELTARVDGWPVSISRVDGRAFPLAELTGRQHGQ